MSYNEDAKRAYLIAKDHGFFDKGQDLPVGLLLVHTEVSEAVEWHRSDTKVAADYLIERGTTPTSIELERHRNKLILEELADVVIRILCMCGARGWNIEKAIHDKMKKNEDRPKMHGGKRY